MFTSHLVETDVLLLGPGKTDLLFSDKSNQSEKNREYHFVYTNSTIASHWPHLNRIKALPSVVIIVGAVTNISVRFSLNMG